MTQPAKIVHLLYKSIPPGIERLVVDLVVQLEKQGCKNEIICINDPKDKPAVNATVVPVHYLVKKSGVNFRIARLLRRLKADVVYAHNEASLQVGGLAAFLAGKKLIFNLHAPSEQAPSRFSLWLASKIIFGSKEIGDHFLKLRNVAQRKCAVIANGINLETFDARLNEPVTSHVQRDLKIRPGKFVVGNISPLVPQEDHATLIKAFRKIVRRDLDADLVIMGNGPLAGDLRDLADSFGLADRVKIVAQREDWPQVLKVFDVFVLTGYQAGRPLVLLEAMAAAKPVIATTIGANMEVVEERTTGFLVPCGFPERIHSAVMRLTAIDTLAREMGQAARRHVQEHFSLPVIAQLHKETIGQMLGKK